MSESICGTCGTVGKPKRMTRGSFVIEVLLWLCFILPGLIYSVWRSSSRYSVCSTCGSLEIVGLDTPRGQSLNREFSFIKN